MSSLLKNTTITPCLWKPSMSYSSAAAHGKLNKFSDIDMKINASDMMVILMMLNLKVHT